MNTTSRSRRWLRALGALCLVSSTTACYLLQSASGQLSLMSKRRPIARVLADPTSPPTLRARLETVNDIREFASRQLGLPDNGSYRSYADVRRSYVVWNVVAAPEFSVEPRLWCFPVVGCVAYRGYFSEQRARSFARRLRQQGYDVMVSGVAAYSTLGHFNDPILNTMLGWDEVDLAGIVFHELTHQLIYIADDAAFNEALATTVEEEGVRRWLSARGREAELANYTQQQARYREVVDLMRRTRETLRALYRLDIGPEPLRAGKRTALGGMRQEYERMRAGWGGAAVFGSWFEGDLDNARLASVATYYDCVPGFDRELAAAAGDLPVFYARVRELARMDRERRSALLCSAATASPSTQRTVMVPTRAPDPTPHGPPPRGSG